MRKRFVPHTALEALARAFKAAPAIRGAWRLIFAKEHARGRAHAQSEGAEARPRRNVGS